MSCILRKIYVKILLTLVMDVSGKTKDNANARLDMEELCATE